MYSTTVVLISSPEYSQGSCSHVTSKSDCIPGTCFIPSKYQIDDDSVASLMIYIQGLPSRLPVREAGPGPYLADSPGSEHPTREQGRLMFVAIPVSDPPLKNSMISQIQIIVI